MSSLEVEGLVKRFNSFVAVDDIMFSIGVGEVFGLLGPNGAGKTTTIRMLACLISPSFGSTRIGGYDIRNDSLKVREIVGILNREPQFIRETDSLRKHKKRCCRNELPIGCSLYNIRVPLRFVPPDNPINGFKRNFIR